MPSIVSNNLRDRAIKDVLESLDYYRFNPEISVRYVGDYYPFLVRDHVLNIFTDPLGNYTLVELCIQNVVNQKWCSSTCFRIEAGGGYTFQTYQFVRFKDIQSLREYSRNTICMFCRRYLTKCVVLLECNPFPVGTDIVSVPESYSSFFVLEMMKNISHR